MTELFREGMIGRLTAEFGSPDIEDVTFEVTAPDGVVSTYRFGADRVVAKMKKTLPGTSGYDCYVSFTQPGGWTYKASGRLMGLDIFTRGEFFVHALPTKYGVKAYATPVEGVPDLPEPEQEKKYQVEGNCVYKENADGSRGELLKCYEGDGGEEQAARYARALYANVPDAKKSEGQPSLAEAALLVLKAITPDSLQQMDDERRKAVINRLRAVIEQVPEADARKDLATRLAALEGGQPLEAPGGFIVKQIGGKFRWFGRPTLNVEDRVGETVSKAFLSELVEREKARGNYPRLEFFHTNYPAGYTDDYRVVDGIMVATGGFNDDPASQAIAKYYVEHPEGTDGSGWAMSWRFRAKADPDGVYRTVSPLSRIREFTFLPTSQAALPVTQFDLKEVA